MKLNLPKKFAEKNQVDNTSFHKMDYNNMSFQDDEFDVIIALESLCHAKDKLPFLKSSYRILGNNGRLIIADYFVTDNIMSPKQQDEIDKLSDEYAVDLYSFEKFKQILDYLPFSNIKFLDITDNILNSYVEGMMKMDRTYKKTLDHDLRKKIKERTGSQFYGI